MSIVAESIGFWELPNPKQKEQLQWSPIPRVARTVPFGYVVSKEDNDILIPVKLELEALEQAKKYLRQYSYREVAHWLSKNTDRYISHVGLQKRVRHEQKRKRTAAVKRQWANRYKKAIEAAEKIENSRLGAKEVYN